ncbi:MAG: phosphoglycerate kinase [Pseudomonadota bacterium]|nr:phosphoglycerate kinase [Pseudomonadota bacterium]
MPINNVNTLDKLQLDGKRVIMRVDFNVPLQNGKITDDTRIKAALPTIEYILARARQLVLASHLGRPDGVVSDLSLEPVAAHLSELLQQNVSLLNDYHHNSVFKLATQMPEEKLIVLENLRFYKEEKSNDRDFAGNLANGFDIYVGEAFGTLHRAHASVVGAPQFFSPSQRGVGFLVAGELLALEKITAAAKPPFLLIIGGAKVRDKITVILNLLKHCHQVLVGGSMAYAFLQHAGYEVSKSRVDVQSEHVEAIIRTAAERKVEIILPSDHVAAQQLAADATPIHVDSPSLPVDSIGLDIGSKTSAQYSRIIAKARTIFWNAPLGKFEWDSYAQGTRVVATAIAANRDAYRVVGGGDSLAALKKFNIDGFDHISTGGGAALQYLAGEPMAGLKALKG